MTLHIFNPEHDLALASGLANFTAPHAGRQLRHDMGWLPALTADEGDAVLVDDVARSQRRLARRRPATRLLTDLKHVAQLSIDRIEPWGWNEALRAQLLRAGVDEGLMPTAAQTAVIRQLSHRRLAARVLPRLRTGDMVGASYICENDDDVAYLLRHYGRLVLKAPWSSSGRGLRFCDASRLNDKDKIKNDQGWLHNVIKNQGTVMAEPYYNKVKDFAMEFTVDSQGNVRCLGLSLFHTQNGAYTGHILATEQAKRDTLARLVPPEQLDSVAASLCQLLSQELKGHYEGPLGVDMMVTTEGLHPCVEINLRRTMGHVALALEQRLNPQADDEVRHVMRINYLNNTYQLQIKRL